MNKKRRTQLEQVLATLENIRADEECACENLPNGLSDSCKAWDMLENVANIEDAIGLLQEVIDP